MSALAAVGTVRHATSKASTSAVPSISGMVTDASSGAPLNGVLVDVYDSGDNFVTTTTTDVSGQYSISGLADGSYEVGFDGSTVGNYEPQFYSGESTLQGADPVDVTAGQTVTGTDASLDQGAAVTGRVTDVSTGAGVGGAQVTLYDAYEGDSIASTTSGADGSYELRGVPAGTYDVTFDGAAAGNYLVQYYRGQTSSMAADPVTVATGQTATGIDAAMRPGGTLSGVVTDAVSHAPVVGAPVTVYDLDGNSVGSATTDSGGAYTVERLSTGSYNVGFAGATGSGYAAQYYDAERSVAFADPVAVTAGHAATGIDAALRSSGEISGVVTDASTNAPIHGVTVRLTSDDSRSSSRPPATPRARTPSPGSRPASTPSSSSSRRPPHTSLPSTTAAAARPRRRTRSRSSPGRRSPT